MWQRGIKYADGTIHQYPHSLFAKRHFDDACDMGNQDGCYASKNIIPDNMVRALDELIKCETGTSNQADSCYAYAQIAKSDDSVLSRLQGRKRMSEAHKEYLKAGGVVYREYEFKRRLSPDGVFTDTCEEYKHPESCFKDAESVYQSNDGKVNLSYFEQWVDVFQHYEMACKATNPIAANKEMACNRREAVKVTLEKYLKITIANCHDTEEIKNGLSNCATVATAYKRGFLFPKYSSKALEYQLRDCVNVMYKSYDSCERAEQLAANGAIVLPPNLKHSAKLYGDACKRHPSLFCIRAGEMYEQGEGVEQSRSEAKMYFKLLMKSRKSACKPKSMLDHTECKEYEIAKARYRKK